VGRLRQFQSRGQGQTRSRRLVAWDRGPCTSQGTISTVTKLPWATGVTLSQESEATIVRIRGRARIHLRSATTAGDGMSGAVGIGIVTDQAAAIGVTAIPGPFTDADWSGWIWHSYFQIYAVVSQVADADKARNANIDVTLDIDSKAMRKFTQNQTLIAMWEVGVELGAVAINVVGDTRVLVKLS